MDSRIGLDYIVENREYVAKLASALDTANTTVKKQVFELLSALCVYNADGYTRTLDALEHFKNLKGMSIVYTSSRFFSLKCCSFPFHFYPEYNVLLSSSWWCLSQSFIIVRYLWSSVPFVMSWESRLLKVEPLGMDELGSILDSPASSFLSTFLYPFPYKYLGWYISRSQTAFYYVVLWCDFIAQSSSRISYVLRSFELHSPNSSSLLPTFYFIYLWSVQKAYD